jgi:soluble lytic murein transglycosylase-like protein
MQAAAAQLQMASIRRMEPSINRQRAALAAFRPAVNRGGRIPLFRRPAEFSPAAGFSPPPGCEALPESQLAPLIASASAKTGVAEPLLRAVIGQESAFNPCAVSAKGAVDLMQLMPETARDLEVADPFDPEQNIGAGGRYLMQLLLRYGGSLPLALGAYNAGPARVDAVMGVPPIPETQNFIERVLTRLGAAARD